MKQVAWIGTGVMGAQQAGHLVKNGYPVRAYNRTYEKMAAQAQELGFTPCASIADAVSGADVIFVMVGYPTDVEEVFCGPGGIFECAKKGDLAVDMTTSSPASASARVKSKISSELGPDAGLWMMRCRICFPIKRSRV